MKKLDQIRMPEKLDSFGSRLLETVTVLLMGLMLGIISKFLDHQHAQLPALLRSVDEMLDFHNFLGGFAPWIVVGVWLSVDSETPGRAAVKVLTFFAGFVASYYLYSHFVAGFFPRNYALIWGGFTVLSPILGFMSWYAKGKGPAALVLSAGVLGVLINTALHYGIFYVGVRSWLDLLMLLLGVWMLRRSPKETAGMVGLAVPIAIVLKLLIPFSLG